MKKAILLFLLLFAVGAKAALITMLGGGEYSLTLTIQPDSKDGYCTQINNKVTTGVSGNLVYMRVGMADVDNAFTGRILIKFDLSALPSDAVISSTTLSLVLRNDYASSAPTYGVYRMKRGWVESEATWNKWNSSNSWSMAGGFHPDDCEQEPIGAITLTTTETMENTIDISLTGTTKDSLDLGNGWLIKADGESNDCYEFESDETITPLWRPRLVIVYKSRTDAVGSSDRISLVTPTSPVVNNDATHPSVYYNENGWNGYKFWMAMTPYAVIDGSSDETIENPEILQSNDGITWTVPAGLTNPIDPEPAPAHNSDAEIIAGITDSMHVFYRETDNSTYETIKLRSSLNGVTWSAEKDLFSTAVGVGAISPSVVYDGAQYIMFYLNTTSKKLLYRTCSTPSGTWSAESECILTGTPTGWNVWHLDVVKTGSNWVAYIIMRFGADGRSWMWLARSSDGLTFTYDPLCFLSPTPSGWDNNRIYRGGPVTVGAETWLYYSAKSEADVWRIGLHKY